MRFAPSLALAAVLLAGTVTLPLPSPAHAEATMPREATIIVMGEADATAAPDLAIVTLGVSKTAKSAREALDANNTAMAAVLKALKDDGIAEKDLQTSGFSIQPQYAYPENPDGTPKTPELTGYTVNNALTIRVRELAKLGDILDKSVTLGVNQGGDIQFTNTDPASAIDTARKTAVKNAIAKARTIAESASVNLGRIVEITENTSRPGPGPVMRMSMAKEAADSVPVAAGENTYTVNVNVTFAIKQ
ncbi:SIMPL domain-containing protein [Rhizobium sp. KVB221]|uniref:SIMPL domain-containing protein n=1 Tax=Rhizobium setariae TaxID=2801340 RepID=A0A936YV09_9HYPH|nr:SIMPL domain-containing protein [Rhizobium setariae]MBL0375349.1 SIMPL domain-containing protein [Rhizobium setariae]